MKKIMKRTISMFLVLAMILPGANQVMAGTVDIRGFNNSNTMNVPKSGDITPVKIDSDVTITSGDSFGEGYLLIKHASAKDNSDIISIQSDSNVNSLNAISIVGDAVYLGTGSGRKIIGSIDSILNGKNGNNLKINFTSLIPNGNFEEKNNSWTTSESNYSISGDSSWIGSGTYDTKIVTRPAYWSWDWVETVDKSDAFMKMELGGWINDSFGTKHGPYITSAAFEANKGDNLSLYYYAANTGDKFDVYGYLIDNDTNTKQTLFYEHGDTTNGWKKISTKITIPSSDNYVFRFVCGSQDGTGGRYIGSKLLIDNVQVTSNAVNAAVVTNIARKAVFQSTTQSPRTLDSNRTFIIEAVDSEGGKYTTTADASVKIHTYPAAPSLTVVPKQNTTDSMNISWAATGNANSAATSYDLYMDNTKIVTNSSTTSKEVTGLGINTSHVFKVVGINDMGESVPYTVTKYTNAITPNVSSGSTSSYEIPLTIQNNGNPSGTKYAIERSTNGTTWSVIENYTVVSSTGDTTTYISTGLNPNTTYYYRVKAQNGDAIATTYSQTINNKTAPAAPNPLAVSAKANTTDQLNVTWTAPVGATQYDVYADGVKVYDNLTETSTIYSGLAPNRPYTMSVYAENATGTSLESQTVKRFTLAAIPTLTLTSATTNTIMVEIANNNNALDTLYRLERSTDGTNWTVLSDFVMAAKATANQTYESANLSPGTVYQYRIMAKNGDLINTAYSAPVSRITIPLAATGLTVTAVESTEDSLMLTWTAPVGASQFDIYQKATGEEQYTLIEEDYMSTVIEVTDLISNSYYSYYIVAKNASGSAVKSSNVGTYTYAAIPEITSSNSEDTNNLVINPNGNPESGSIANTNGTLYMVQYSDDNGTTWTDLREWIDFLEPQHSNVIPGKTYLYRVKAKNGNNVETLYSGTSTARSNDDPVITITQPNEDTILSWQNGYRQFTISGTVKDNDSDPVRISTTINGKKKSTVVYATPDGVSWSLTFNTVTDAIAESTYNTIIINGNDGFGGIVNTTWDHFLMVDKTGPGLPSITTNTDWTKDTEVSVTVGDGIATGALTMTTEYKLSGATVSDWTIYEEEFTIENAGETTIMARSYDRVGNVSNIQTAVVRIDRTAPTVTNMVLQDMDGTVGFTDNRIIAISNIVSFDTGGAGNGEVDTVPISMQISNLADFSDATWVDFASTYDNFTLENMNGERTVYFRTKDTVGNISETYHQTIIFDNIPPTLIISAPSRFNVKKGMTVSYDVTISENATLSGINALDVSKINLTAAGTFTEQDLTNLEAGVSIENINEQTRRINIHIPNDISAEGTIGMKIEQGAATDTIGNTSVETVANASFVIDAVAPNCQELLFNQDSIIKGGQGITLLRSSESCEGGYDSDSVRFAPAGYTGAEAANGVTITSTHGRSTVINAPTQEGTYYLYIIDAAGNISGASTATLTVKNNGPTVTLSGPSKVSVNAGLSVDYFVTYSADTIAISLEQSHIALETTGTANAYVEVNEVPGESLQKKITLKNLMGEGTVAIKIAQGSAVDAQTNPALASIVSQPVKVDNTSAMITTVGMSSNNTTGIGYAKKGDTVIIEFTADESIDSVVATLDQIPITFTAIDMENKSWTVSYTLPQNGVHDSIQGEVIPFALSVTDLAGNVSDLVTQIDAVSTVIYDITPPVITFAGTKDSMDRYSTEVNVSYDEGTAILINLDTLTEERINSPAIIIDEGNFKVVVTDGAGNETTKLFTINYGSILLEKDLEALEIQYAAGDSASGVRKNLGLPLIGATGSIVTWTSDDNAVEIVDDVNSQLLDIGSVTRPVYVNGNDDVVVTLTANISKDGLTDTKTFEINIKGNPDPTQGLEEVQDDAKAAKIYYGYEDHKNSVTQDIELSATGFINNSSLTWISDQPDLIRISENPLNDRFQVAVIRPAVGEEDLLVTLTVTAIIITGDEENPIVQEAEEEFVILVKAMELSDAEKARLDYAGVSLIFADGDNLTSVTQDISRVENLTQGSTVTWKSSDTGFLTATGEITRPTYEEGDKEVILTATIVNGIAKIDKTYYVTIKRDSSPQTIAEEDASNVGIGYYGQDHAGSVTTHLILVSSAPKGSTVVWQSSDDVHVAADGLVTRDGSDHDVTLTATVTNKGNSVTKQFIVKVKATDESDILKQIYEDATNLFIQYVKGDSQNFVTENVVLRNKGANGTIISWSSNYPNIITSSGIVTLQNVAVPVTLTATVKKYSADIGYYVNRIRSFTLMVQPSQHIDVEGDMDDVEIIYAYQDTSSSVKNAMYFSPVGTSGSNVTWASSNLNYVSNNGKVTRPGPEDQDRKVTITATITYNGLVKTKVFDIIVLKMTNEEAVKDAARKMSVSDAFSFSDEDIWESVTKEFLMLTKAGNDTSISWASSHPDIITFGAIDEDGRQEATVTRPQERDQNVILTATFTRNGFSITKTYLLVVKAIGATKDAATTRVPLDATQFEVTAGAEDDLTDVYRTVVQQQGGGVTNIDTVVFTPDKVEELTENINPEETPENRTLRLFMFVDENAEEDDQTDEQAIEVPALAVNSLAQRNMLFTIQSPFADIELSAASIQKLDDKGTDLYFRIVPIKEEVEVGNLKDQMGNMVPSSAEAIGSPKMIETNYSGVDTYIVLPFGEDFQVPEGDFYKLRVYISHSDGTKELREGTVVYKDGTAYGLRILITHFSEFQLYFDPTITKGSNSSEETIEKEKVIEEVIIKGSDLEEILKKEKEVVITIGEKEVTIHEGDIDLDDLKKKLGIVDDNFDIEVTIKDQVVPELDTTKEILEKEGLTLLGTPFEYKITGTSGNRNFDINPTQGYVVIRIPMEEGMKITTAVRIGEDGSVIHIPTEVMVIDGAYYAIIHTLVTGVFAFIWNPQEFLDVEQHWAREAINDMYSRLIVTGVDDGHYLPDQSITRAEFAAILVRSLGLLRGVGDETFDDVEIGSWYEEYIQTAVSYGFIKGYGDGNFGPDDQITREQAMTMIARLMPLTRLATDLVANQLSETLSLYSDRNLISEYAKDAVALNIEHHIVIGTHEDVLDPKEYVTRAQTAMMIRRFLQESGLIEE